MTPYLPHISPIPPPHLHLPCISPISPSRSTTSPLYLPHLAYISEQEDHMTSFFLAETLKYLYLLFDEAS